MRFIYWALLTIAAMILSAGSARAQTPTPTPSVTASIERIPDLGLEQFPTITVVHHVQKPQSIPRAQVKTAHRARGTQLARTGPVGGSLAAIGMVLLVSGVALRRRARA